MPASKYLKGNYKGPRVRANSSRSKKGKSVLDGFEDAAVEKLGGSIAFVMKSKTLLWTPSEDNK